MGKKAIDCLLIGHNEMDFREYEKTIMNMGAQSGAYRDLNLNFIQYNNRPYTAAEIFNLFGRDGKYWQAESQPVGLGRCFSASVAYLGTWLHRRNYTFDYVTSFKDRESELAQKLEQENILTVAIITTLYVAALPILEIMSFIKKYNQTAKIIVGGPFISTQVRTQKPGVLKYLFNTIGADFYVNSIQGEAALVKIIAALKNNLSPEGINNIYFKPDRQDTWAATPILKEDNKLSDNMVDWGLFSRGMEAFAATRTAISCPFSCAFCGYPEHAGKYQTTGVEAIETELKSLDKTGKVKDLHFIDDTFNIPVKRFKEILRMMIKNKFKFKWHSYFRCQYADGEMVRLMKESGCEGVFLGIESGSQQILENMNKKARVEDYLEGISLLKRHGIATFGNFIIGFPGETEETVRETVEFIKQSEMDFYRAQLWYCDPITPIGRQKEKYNIQGDSFHWTHETMDYKRACDLIDKIFIEIDDPVWIPLYNFDFDTIWQLVHRGMGLPGVKEFLESFNQGIKKKLQEPSQKEISYEVISRLKRASTGEEGGEGTRDKNDRLDHEDAEFDF